MKLQARDLDIINYLSEFKGATIDHIATLYFNSSYEAAKKRLKILEENNHIKGEIHEILDRKVYFAKKKPSYHRLVANEIRITLMQHVQLVDFKFEVKIDKHKIDAMAVYKKEKVVILLIEVDIFNRTKDEKFLDVKKVIKQKTGTDPRLLVVSKHKRRSSAEIGIVNIEEKKIRDLMLII